MNSLEKTTQRRRDAEERPQIRARKAARGDRGLQMPNPRTAPLGVILVAGLPTSQAIVCVGQLDTPAIIEQAIRAEGRCMARSAVLAALRARLTKRNNAETQRRRDAEEQRRGGKSTTKGTKGRKA